MKIIVQRIVLFDINKLYCNTNILTLNSINLFDKNESI